MLKKIIPYLVWFVLQFMIFCSDVDAANVDNAEFGAVYEVQTSEQLVNTSSGDAVAVESSVYQETVVESLKSIDKNISILTIVIIILFGVWISITFMRNIFRK